MVNGVIEPDSLSGVFSVSAGATLAGSGNLKRTVNIAGTLDSGDGTGVLTMGNVTFADSSTFALTLDSKTAYDRLNVVGISTYSIRSCPLQVEGEQVRPQPLGQPSHLSHAVLPFLQSKDCS